ncbi:MAG: DUF5107 domain-containing protein [Caldilineaceae bacterium]|nr:DUF5107 domain-containing protein [Caldilineaceae bacterium]
MAKRQWAWKGIVLLSILLLAACAAPAPVVSNVGSEAPPALAERVVSPTENSEAAATPTAEAEPTVAPATATAELTDLPATDEPFVLISRTMNVRSGPGTTFEIVGSAQPGQRFPILGVNAAGDWWQIDLNGRAAWIYAPFVQAENAEDVTVAQEIPEAPTPVPTATTDPAAPPTATPIPATLVEADSIPAPAPVGTVVVYESSVTLSTYPIEAYQSDARNETFNWPYKRFDRERFQNERPAPSPRTYRLIILENAYLKVTILPQLGGRVWQAIHKGTGANMFYQNSVVKPSPWGPGEQLGWTALGGLEWNLPVVEHGYDWGVEWGYIPLQHSEDLASVTLFTPRDGRYLNASVTISLRSGAGSFEVEPTITNLSGQSLSFAYWQTAMLAPGRGNRPGGSTQFILPASQMTVHSSEDARLPGPNQPFGWPIHNGVDYSRLGNWTNYLGFFERPSARGPFVGIYDHDASAGAVRVFPAGVARGSKVFGLGWHSALGSDNFTDDGSAYVELHGGLMPTFDETYTLPPGGAVGWREVWYPIHTIDGLTYADEGAAIHVRPSADGLAVGFYPTRPMGGALIALSNGRELERRALRISPDEPFNDLLIAAANLPGSGPIEIRFEDGAGRLFFSYTYSGPIR